jgi:hypothetical protein
MNRFIRVLQKDIVTNPEQWKDAGPGKFIKLPDRAKKVYCVLSVIAFSTAGNAEGKFARNVGKLGKDWFWTSHAILQQLTGSCQKTVQRAIKELEKAGFIGYHPARKNGHQCFFKIKRISYNSQESYPDTFSRPKSVGNTASTLPYKNDAKQNKTKETDNTQSETVELEIPYYNEGELFQKGNNTHDAEGGPIDKNGVMAPRIAFQWAEDYLEEEDEEKCLETVVKWNIENHLTPKYRAKLAKIKNR